MNQVLRLINNHGKKLDKEIAILAADWSVANTWSKKLSKIGFLCLKAFTSKDDLFRHMSSNKVDVLLIDYFIEENYTALNFISANHDRLDCPVILTLDIDGLAHFGDWLECYPYEMLSLSSSYFDVYKSIMYSTGSWESKNGTLQPNDFILVKKNSRYQRIDLNTIEYIEVNGKYLFLQANGYRYIVRDSLTNFQKKLPSNFIKIHQSFVINQSYIVALNSDFSFVFINDFKIPVSRACRKHLKTTNFLFS